MMYTDMAQRADPAKAHLLADVLLRIYEADRTNNNGFVTGEATLSLYFKHWAKHVLTDSGVLDKEAE